MRRATALLFAALLISALTACSSDEPSDSPDAPSIEGTWQRLDSPFPELTGMVVEIGSGETTGVIVDVPENRYLFVVGDEKWTDITNEGGRVFSFDDLVREENTGAMSTVSGEMTLSDDGDTLDMTFSTGTTQTWTRTG